MRHTLPKESKPETKAWWRGLSAVEKARVMRWLKHNEPPKSWDASRIDYAFTEMMVDEIYPDERD